MRVLSVRLRKPDMLEKSMPGKRYVSLSALSGIFCRVGDNVLSPPEALELPILRHLQHISLCSLVRCSRGSGGCPVPPVVAQDVGG
jgi:hypothetical protein